MINAQTSRTLLFFFARRAWHRCCSTTSITIRMTILRRYVELDGRRVSCLTAGDPSSATPLLLIHGSGVSAGYWVNQLLGLPDAFPGMAIASPRPPKPD